MEPLSLEIPGAGDPWSWCGTVIPAGAGDPWSWCGTVIPAGAGDPWSFSEMKLTIMI